MSKQIKYVVWSAVILIDFLLINVGLDGWFMGFASGSFIPKLKQLFLENYFESLIIPILLSAFAYVSLSFRINARSVIDKIKQTSSISIFILIVVFQSIYFFISLGQIKTLSEQIKVTNKEVEFINASINNESYYSASLYLTESSVKERLNKINETLEDMDSKIDNLEIEVQSLQR